MSDPTPDKTVQPPIPPDIVWDSNATEAFQQCQLRFAEKLQARAEARASLRGKKPSRILVSDVQEAFEKFTCNIA